METGYMSENSSATSVLADTENSQRDIITFKNVFKEKCYNGVPSGLILHGINLKCYRGELTALIGLGDNSGLEEILELIAGSSKPLEGTINVFGIRSDLPFCSWNVFHCPSRNFLFQRLTVKENIINFGKLKGITRETIDIYVNMVFKSTQLKEYQDFLLCKLPYALQRRLYICMTVHTPIPVVNITDKLFDKTVNKLIHI